MSAIGGGIKANTNHALARAIVVCKIKKLSSPIIGKLAAYGYGRASAVDEEVAAGHVHVPGAGRIDFRIHAADAGECVSHPQMTHRPSCEIADGRTLHDDSGHRIGVMVLRILVRRT